MEESYDRVRGTQNPGRCLAKDGHSQLALPLGTHTPVCAWNSRRGSTGKSAQGTDRKEPGMS